MNLEEKQRIINGLIAEEGNQCTEAFFDNDGRVCARGAIAKTFGLAPLLGLDRTTVMGLDRSAKWLGDLVEIENWLGLSSKSIPIEDIPEGVLPPTSQDSMYELYYVLQRMNDNGFSLTEIARWVDDYVEVEDPIDTTELEQPVVMASA